MAWPAWNIDEPAALARYVVSELAEGVLLDIVRDDAIKRGARRDVVRAIYDAMLKRDFHYSREIWSPGDGSQIIRDPDDMFDGGNATCLDLALLFAGVCLGHELLPLVVVVEGHALVAVSLLDDPREPVGRARVGRDGTWLDHDGVLNDREVFERLIDNNGGHYLPVECTGFAKTEVPSDEIPQGRGRSEGKLDFESAIAAARSQCASRRFMFAVDPAVRQRVRGVALYDRSPSVKRITQDLLSIFPQMESVKQEANEREFEQSYLEQVAIKYRRVETPGVPDLKEFRQRLTLAYVSLFVKGADTEREIGRRRAEYVLEAEPLLVVRAPAGAGKTTLLNWVALACAQGANLEANGRWHGGVPFFVPLRTLKDGGTPDPSQFVDYTIDLKQWPILIPPGWIVRVLRAKRAVIMLDGVDELPPKARPDFWKWVNDELMQRYPGNRIIITSRYLPESSGKPPAGFASVDLDEMTDEDVGHFVGQWHDGALDGEKDPLIKAELVKARDALPNKLADVANHRVRELCGTPLLCSLICALHWHEEGYLPGRRIDLYERCVVMLVEERDLKRGVQKPKGPLGLITRRDKEMLLQRIAYQMMKNVMPGEESRARIEISKEQAIRWVAGGVPNFANVEARECKPSDVLEHLLERTGLLRSPVSETIEFSHRTFQEYLAACAAGAADDWADLARRANDDQWHEIIILAAGTNDGGIPFGNRLILALLNGGESEKTNFLARLLRFQRKPDLRHTYLALAVACLETAKQPDPEISARVLGYLKEIVPPRDFAAAKHLSAAGEAALPHLGYERWKDGSEQTVSSCARAVRLIGGALATRMLIEGYGSDERSPVLAEVARATGVSVFDIPAVKTRLLADGMIPGGLLSFVNDLRGLEGLSGGTCLSSDSQSKATIPKLNLAGCSSVTDLAPLAVFENLESLDVSWCAAVDLKPLAALARIRELRLTGCQKISDLTPLAALQSLESLSLSHCGGIHDLGPLAAVTKLKELDLSSCAGITDLAPLAPLQDLSKLNLSGIGDLELPALNKLSTLWIFGSERLTDLAPLIDHQSSLRALAVTECKGITDLTALTGKGVQYLYLDDCTGITDIAPLASLKSLVSLDLSGCTGITDLEPLASLERLSSLDLNGCKGLSDLRPLQALRNLGTLELSRLRSSSLSGRPDRTEATRYFGSRALDAVGGARLLAEGIAHVARSLTKPTPAAASVPDGRERVMSMIDLGQIGQLTSLKKLVMKNWDGMKALPSLNALEHLEDLDISGWRELLDLTPLAPLINLRQLDLEGCERITDIGPLRALRNLQKLSLVGVSGVVDFSPLLELDLKVISVSKPVHSLPPSLRPRAQIKT